MFAARTCPARVGNRPVSAAGNQQSRAGREARPAQPKPGPIRHGVPTTRSPTRTPFGVRPAPALAGANLNLDAQAGLRPPPQPARWVGARGASAAPTTRMRWWWRRWPQSFGGVICGHGEAPRRWFMSGFARRAMRDMQPTSATQCRDARTVTSKGAERARLLRQGGYVLHPGAMFCTLAARPIPYGVTPQYFNNQNFNIPCIQNDAVQYSMLR